MRREELYVVAQSVKNQSMNFKRTLLTVEPPSHAAVFVAGVYELRYMILRVTLPHYFLRYRAGRTYLNLPLSFRRRDLRVLNTYVVLAVCSAKGFDLRSC